MIDQSANVMQNNAYPLGGQIVMVSNAPQNQQLLSYQDSDQVVCRNGILDPIMLNLSSKDCRVNLVAATPVIG